MTFANWSLGNQSVDAMARRGYAEPETIEATERAAALAEKSGNLAQLVGWMSTRGNTAHDSGDLPAASALADQALELALREGSPTSLGSAHALQMLARYLLATSPGPSSISPPGSSFSTIPASGSSRSRR